MTLLVSAPIKLNLWIITLNFYNWCHSKLTPKSKKQLIEAIEKTKNNNRMTLILLLAIVANGDLKQ